MIGWIAGALAALLQTAGALKSLLPLPFDLSLVAAMLLAPPLLLLGCGRRWWLSPALGWPLLGVALLWFWLLLSACWSTSHEVLAEMLPQLLLLGPLLLLAGMAAGADAGARHGLAGMSLLLGLLVLLLLLVPAAAPAPRLQYQLTGLAMAAAAGLAAVRVVQDGRLLAPLWLLLSLALGFGVLLPGGRAALVALGLAMVLLPALSLLLRRQRGLALLWLLASAGCGALALLLLSMLDLALPSLQRFAPDGAGATPARLQLWAAALHWAGAAAPLGLGLGGFPIAAGHGDDRHLHGHNHALEALAEAGLPGLLFWLMAFGGAALLAWRQGPRLPPARVTAIAALVLPVALSAMVSTDLGNRMVWFALGLLLSLGIEARPRHV